jgi:hypothetical protein
MKLFRFATRIALCGILCAMFCTICTAMQVKMQQENKNIICIGQKVAVRQAWRSTNPADKQNITAIIDGTTKDLKIFFQIRNQLKTGQPIDVAQLRPLIKQITDEMIRQKAESLLQKAGIMQPVTLENPALKVLEERIKTFAMDTSWSDLPGAEKILQEILYSPAQQSGEKQKGGNDLYNAIIAVANDPTQTEELGDLEARLQVAHQEFLEKIRRTKWPESQYPAGKLTVEQFSLCIDNIHTEAREAQEKK